MATPYLTQFLKHISGSNSGNNTNSNGHHLLSTYIGVPHLYHPWDKEYFPNFIDAETKV